MGHLRERYNERARRSSHPSKRRKRNHESEPPDSELLDTQDSNAPIHAPKSKEQKEEERRERLKKELLEQQENSKASSKKKKRLEKYIDKKLKKEERVRLFEKLAQSQAQVSSLLQFQPSSTLGSRDMRTNDELRDKAEDKDVRRLMDGRVKGSRRKRNIYSGNDGFSEDEDDLSGGDDAPEENATLVPGTSKEFPVLVEDNDVRIAKQVPEKTELSLGSALRRNADGTVQAPIVVDKKRKNNSAKSTFRRRWKRRRDSVDENASEASFDSSDSANDDSDANESSSSSSHHHTDDDSGSDKEPEWTGFGDDSDGSTGSASEKTPDSSVAAKRGGFKIWALQQLSAAKEYVAPPAIDGNSMIENEVTPVFETKKEATTGRGKTAVTGRMKGPLGEDLQLPNTAFALELKSSTANSAPKKVSRRFVKIERQADIQAERLRLPILAEEQPIVEAIRMHPVVVLCGATGSGKTTQVPQFLYEAGFACPGSDNPGMIGITQPRRVAAMAMAMRVGQELALPSRVAYQVRYDTTTAPSTAIKFMTDGILLRELATDFTLSKYSVIIVDEAHERSVNTDILIGVLSRIVRLREDLWKEDKINAKPLRLIIMSATLRVSDFAENTTLFATPPPILRADARQYPVAIHFARRTTSDYVSEAIKKTCKIHARLPPGGILIFLTGQNEITGVCKKLEARYGRNAISSRKRKRGTTFQNTEDPSDSNVQVMKVPPVYASVEIEDIELGDSISHFDNFDDGDLLKNPDPEALETDDEEEENRQLGIDIEDSEVPMHVLPLYSILPTDQQMLVFKPPPDGMRLVVVATNVAETSLTIPGIRYVVDCGRAKERCYDDVTGVQTFRVNWISKASAEQRAGRAGRTGPGHCYRLYSSALFENHFEEFARPEILKTPIEGVVLQMKSMHIDTVTNFPFPTPPDRSALQNAEKLLTYLGALQSTSQPMAKPSDTTITELGRTMSLFPLSPRFSKMLVSGRQHGCLPYVVAIVSALSVGDPFLHEEALQTDGRDTDSINDNLDLIKNQKQKEKEENRLRRKAFFQNQELHSRLGKGSSDILRILSVVGAYEFSGGGYQFCQDHFVRPKAMEEIHKLRAQISSIVSMNFHDLDSQSIFDGKLKPPSELQIKVLRQLLCATFIDKVAARKDLVQTASTSGNKYASCQGIPYRALGVNEDVFIHPSSVLFSRAPPEFVVFQEAVRSSKVFIKMITCINPAWIAVLGKGKLCTFSKPISNGSGKLMVIPHFGPDNWELPAIAADSIA